MLFKSLYTPGATKEYETEISVPTDKKEKFVFLILLEKKDIEILEAVIIGTSDRCSKEDILQIKKKLLRGFQGTINGMCTEPIE